MKAIVTSKHLVSILALMLAIVMCFSACGNNGDTPSDTASAGDTNITDNSADQKTDDASSNEDNAQDASSDKGDKPQSSKQQQSTQQQPQSSGSTTWDKDYLSTMPQAVKDKGVTILMWRKLHKTEQQLLDDFVKKTGCKVKVVETTEKEYSTKLISMLQAKESPDVCVLETRFFPSFTQAMQPLDAKVFRLDDSCWNKTYMDTYSVNGKYFSVAMPKSWSCEDTLYVTYYQPKVLENCGVSTTPWQLYTQGKWDWAAQKDIIQKVTGAGKGYTGICLQTWDLFMLSAGEDFVTYDGKTYTNKFKAPSSTLVKSWQEIAKLNQEKSATKWDLNKVLEGKIGLFTSIAYGMYNEGNWGFDNIANGGFQSIECVPVAGPSQSSAYTPVSPKTWGTAKGAKNPEGAAYFLRYWLDVTNCNFDSTFINSQAKTVFDEITKTSHKKQIRFAAGAVNSASTGQYESIMDSLVQSPTNVSTVFASKQGMVQTGIDRANRYLERVR